MPVSPTETQRFVLDTDIYSLLALSRTAGEQYPHLIERIKAAGNQNIFLRAVTLEESVRGALAEIRREETRGKGTSGYALLSRIITALAQYPVLPFDDAANAIYLSYPASVRRNGADCKIAAVAQVNNAVVVTRNTRHFAAIPGVRYEDWTLP